MQRHRTIAPLFVAAVLLVSNPARAQHWQSGGSISVPVGGVTGIAVLFNAIPSNIALNNTANYFDGPTVAQGSVGTWFVSGTVAVFDTTATNIFCKLWDGTNVIASTPVTIASGSSVLPVSLSGVIAAPAGNLRISCRDTANATGTMEANVTGLAKDSSITAYRIN
jgi:hypothetical protein